MVVCGAGVVCSCSLYIGPLLKEYNSLPTTQTTNRVPQNCVETT